MSGESRRPPLQNHIGRHTAKPCITVSRRRPQKLSMKKLLKRMTSVMHDAGRCFLALFFSGVAHPPPVERQRGWTWPKSQPGPDSLPLR